jgi:hypothetical protein
MEDRHGQRQPRSRSQGLWRQWKEADGSLSLAFTMLTVNSDVHPLRKAQRYRDKFGKPVA